MVLTKCGFDNLPGGQPAHELLVSLGPTLIVDIGFDPTFDPSQLAAGKLPVPGIRGLHGLVDTGATESCIDNLLAAQLNLPIVDRRMIAGSVGRHQVNVYLAQVHVPFLTYTIFGAFAGVDLKAGGQMHSALIGRTFLRGFTMVYEGRTGTVTISND
jgi:predicted aspartyl protease